MHSPLSSCLHSKHVSAAPGSGPQGFPREGCQASEVRGLSLTPPPGSTGKLLARLLAQARPLSGAESSLPGAGAARLPGAAPKSADCSGQTLPLGKHHGAEARRLSTLGTPPGRPGHWCPGRVVRASLRNGAGGSEKAGWGGAGQAEVREKTQGKRE